MGEEMGPQRPTCVFSLPPKHVQYWPFLLILWIIAYFQFYTVWLYKKKLIARPIKQGLLVNRLLRLFYSLFKKKKLSFPSLHSVSLLYNPMSHPAGLKSNLTLFKLTLNLLSVSNLLLLRNIQPAETLPEN